MKKIILAFIITLLSFNLTNAWCWEENCDYEINTNWKNNDYILDVSTENIKDKSLKAILDKNETVLLTNTFSDDGDYNIKNFSTTKIKFEWKIPEDIKSKLSKLYLIWLNSQDKVSHWSHLWIEGWDFEASGNSLSSISSDIKNWKANFYFNELNIKDFKSEYILETQQFQKYIPKENENYGATIVFILYWEFSNWDNFPLSFINDSVLIRNLNSYHVKRDVLANLYVEKYASKYWDINNKYSYDELREKLNIVFTKSKSKYKTKESYDNFLISVQTKVRQISEKKELALLKKINKEEDLVKYIKEFKLLVIELEIYDAIYSIIGEKLVK